MVDRLVDETLRSAWWRFVRLWRPMAAWTLIVFALMGLLLGPISSYLLGFLAFRGERVVVGNEDLVAWLLDPIGLLYLALAGGLAIMGAVVRYAGLFRILTDDLVGRKVSARRTLFELFPDLPNLFRLCVAAVTLAALLVVPLVLGIGGIYYGWLGAYDINYYLFVQPPEWRRALIAAGIWGAAWALGTGYVVLRSLPALPAYLDGHRPILLALRQAWARTKGDAARILWLLFLSVLFWLLLRVMSQTAYFFLSAFLVDTFERLVASLTAVILATGAWLIGSLVLDAILSFVGFSLIATVLTKFYYEDTDLHAIAPPIRVRILALPWHGVKLVVRWLHPFRAVPVLAALILMSAAFSGWLLRSISDELDFTVTAHRAGAFLATENTLAALERSIEAGADYAEIDVQRTRDGIVVVKHDADLMRLAGDPRRIADSDFEDLREVVLGREDDSPPEERLLASLDTFLDRARGRIGLMIELKYYGPDPLLAPHVVERVRAMGMEDEVMIISLDLTAVRQVRRIAPEIRTGYLATVSVGDLARLPVDMLGVSRPMATDRLIRAARRQNIEVHVWTLNRLSSMYEAVQRGADGIITDDPPLALRLRDELGALSTPERLLLQMRNILPDFDAERTAPFGDDLQPPTSHHSPGSDGWGNE